MCNLIRGLGHPAQVLGANRNPYLAQGKAGMRRRGPRTADGLQAVPPKKREEDEATARVTIVSDAEARHR